MVFPPDDLTKPIVIVDEIPFSNKAPVYKAYNVDVERKIKMLDNRSRINVGPMMTFSETATVLYD